jgi:hypothetical protein
MCLTFIIGSINLLGCVERTHLYYEDQNTPCVRSIVGGAGAATSFCGGAREARVAYTKKVSAACTIYNDFFSD